MEAPPQNRMSRYMDAVRTLFTGEEAGLSEKETILIVDDDPDISYLIKLFLDRKGYPSIIASGGQECLDILKNERPGVILLDVLMAPMDGWKTLEHIKKDPRTKTIPTLILTGKAITPAEARQYNICIEDYVMKPFGQNDLYAAVEQVLLRKRKIEESIVLAKKAGVDKEMFCEFAKLSKRVSVNRKLIGMLEKTYRGPVREEIANSEARKVIEQMVMTTRSSEDRIEQLKREIGSAFRAKGFPMPSW